MLQIAVSASLATLKCCKLQHSLVLEHLKCCKEFQKDRGTTEPPDQRITGQQDQGTRATPGPSHTLAKKAGPYNPTGGHHDFFKGPFDQPPHKVVYITMRTTIQTQKCCYPYYGDPSKTNPKFGKPHNLRVNPEP